MYRSSLLTSSVLALAAIACSSPSSSTPNTAPAPAAASAPAASADTGAAAASAGAAGNVAGDTIQQTEVLVNVINNRVPPAVVTVYAIGPSIGRKILGDVQSGVTKAFTFRAGNLNGDYYLMAQGTGGAQLRSQKFNLTPTLRFVQWSMDINTIVQYQTPR